MLRLNLLAAASLLLCQCSIVNKSPAHLDAATFAAPDGKTMPFTRWPADDEKPAKPRAIVICVHGLSGAASDFWPAGETLSKKGIVVYGTQLRGMGNDPAKHERGDIKSVSRWTNDLVNFTKLIRQKHPGVPTFWYGESLGSLIVLQTLHEESDQAKLVDGVVLSSPVIAFRNDLPWWKYLFIRGLVLVHPGKRISLESLGDGEVKVTAKTTHKEQMEKTPHYVEFFTLRLFRAVDKMVRNSDRAAASVQVPTLVFYTPNDVFTSKEQVEHFYDQIPAKEKEKAFYPNSYHLLLHDTDRQAVLQELDQWLEKRISRG